METDPSTRIKVFAGICGFTTTIHVTAKPGYKAQVVLETDCPNYKKVGASLEGKSLNVMDEMFKKQASVVLDLCNTLVPHISCPVPSAIFKALEVSAKLALPCDPTITFLD